MQRIQAALQRLVQSQDLTAAEMTAVMQCMMCGEATPAQIGGLLVALHLKGERVVELTAAAKVLREYCLPVKLQAAHLVDIVGTGGDNAHLFNISTTSAFVMAAAGATVAKHNNRAISSASGSADVLTLANINAFLTPEQIAICIKQLQIGFMFAPHHHKAWQTVAAIRRELGIRTLFNLLGPLANPAQVPNLLVGVPAKQWVEIFAQAFYALGEQHVLVVHSEDGLDEISIAAPTFVAELNQGQIKTYTITPENFGLQTSSLNGLRVKNPAESYILMQSVFNNQPGPACDIVCLNAGAGLYAANLATNIADGINKAAAVIASGAAKEKFIAYQQLSQSFSGKDR